MAESKHRYDANQCLKMAYDPDACAFKMIPSDQTSFAIELDHKDGDSVYSVPIHKNMKGLGEMDISDCVAVHVYGAAEISLHPSDDIWLPIASGYSPVAACRIRSTSENTYIVARS